MTERTMGGGGGWGVEAGGVAAGCRVRLQKACAGFLQRCAACTLPAGAGFWEKSDRV